MKPDLKGPLVLLAILLGVVVLASVLFLAFGAPVEPEQVANQDPWWPRTPEVQAKLDKSRGFEVLILYTDKGFAPRETELKEGQSARFFNNSSHELWVAADNSKEGSALYPGVGKCDTSPLDSCHALPPNDFWEFTFEKSGVWGFRDNINKEKTGVVRVSAP